jgi:uncharacterized protein
MHMKQLEYIDQLTSGVCATLLGSHEVGRLGFVDSDGYPIVRPFNYACGDNRIVVRTDMGETFDLAVNHKVSFEIDEFFPVTRTGWSVVARGFATDVTGVFRLNPEIDPYNVPCTWVPGEGNHFLAIEVESVSGRQIVRSL